MKHTIKPGCMSPSYSKQSLKREWEVDHKGKIWPCCVWIRGWDSVMTLHPDDKLAKLLKDDPDFNDLSKHTWEEIMDHPIYKSYINTEGWESDNPSPICVRECGVKGYSKHQQVSIKFKKE